MTMRRKIVAGLFLLLIGLYVVFRILSQPAPDRSFFVEESMLVIAHQGGDHVWPGNTMFAFTNAVALGVDVLEMDMHATSDGVLILMHDATIDRTTDGVGAINDMRFEALRQVDAAFDWSRDDGETFPFRGQGIVVPSLEEVLTAFPDFRFNIEIKQASPSIVEPFCAMLREFDVTDQTLVASFHAETMQEFRLACPEVATSGVEPEIRLFFVLHKLFLPELFQTPTDAFQVPEYLGNIHVVTERFVKNAQKHNVDVHVWTVNDETDMQRLIDVGVDGIITDRPDLLLEVTGRK